ncbi:HAD-IA family hydrolase [Streptomyces sp. UH6]|uniref:HAD-IA family hydrolase n=1 Tax=Streptomyces sp. UH6 TaxID=2748379 RepID=UPI0015D4FF23|nr:HAD-IA family hydrolase [Streptomyces sp. UH6]NYV76885.1 HAD-IA family hydrolase [Streptomyces sp. UH6]
MTTLRADALLFDNDGTLLSSLDSVTRSWTAWAHEHGVTHERFTSIELHGRPAVEIIRDLLPAPRVPAALARIEEIELEDVPHGGVVPLPGTREFLRGLPADRWAVVTSASRRLAEARLALVGLTATTLIAADDITRGKPDPEPYLLAAKALGVDPARCVVFEDAPAGLRSGRAAGMRTVALATTLPAHELDADLVVPDLSALSAQVTPDGIVVSPRV